jgi:hypothetical protein
MPNLNLDDPTKIYVSTWYTIRWLDHALYDDDPRHIELYDWLRDIPLVDFDPDFGYVRLLDPDQIEVVRNFFA